MAAAQKVVTAVRSSRSDYGLTVREKAALMLTCSDGSVAASLAELTQEIGTLTSSSSVRLLRVRTALSEPRDASIAEPHSLSISRDSVIVSLVAVTSGRQCRRAHAGG